MKPERLAELRKMRRDSKHKGRYKTLFEEGRKLGLKFGKNDTKANCIKKIIQAEALKDAESMPTEPVTLERPANPAFEAATHSTPVVETSHPGERSENRGGPREGAGRPPGMTAEKARMKHLPEQPNPAIQSMVEMAFEAWSKKVKVLEVALTKQEAFDLALPYTQVLSYVGYDEKIPPWLMIAISSTWNTYNVIKLKMSIIKVARPELFVKPITNKTESKENKPDGTQPGSDNLNSHGQAGVGQDAQGPQPTNTQKSSLVL